MKNSIEVDGFKVDIVKSARRKTMALKVNHNGVSVHIPSRFPLKLATQFIIQKTDWIKLKLKQLAVRLPIEKKYCDGETFLFLGETCSLRLQQQETTLTVKKIDNDINITGRLNRSTETSIKKALIHWYKQQSERYLQSQTQVLAEKTGLTPRSTTVKTYKARWGSCKITGEIQFNWKLILAPPAVIDYVIVHELCHLAHHNHSATFWQLVVHHYPHFKQAKQWLKDNGYRLEI